MSSHQATKENMPPKRERKGMRPVSPPGSNMSLNRFIYILVGLSALFIAFYAYRITTWKNEVGGWWNLAMGKKAPVVGNMQSSSSSSSSPPRRSKDETVQDRIEALAEALGMPSKDLASAIAAAVKEYVPPASLSSVAAHETGEAVNIIAKGTSTAESTGPTGVAGSVIEGLESFVGMDEPV